MRRSLRRLIFAPLAALSCAAPRSTESAEVRLEHTLPSMDGAHLHVTLMEVAYGPGGSSAPHRHPCPVVGYVIEGALRTQVRGGPVETYHAGQSFYEAPDGVHEVLANASDREPVRFLATFLCDRATPLVVPEAPASLPNQE